jgi:hypothetical protein
MLIMLTSTIRLTIKPTMKLKIHNQYPNVDLVSPTYVTGDTLACYRPPSHEVRAEGIMQAGFIVDSDKEADGALVYRLQKKQSCESTKIDESASRTIYLLVIWGFSEFKKLCVDVLLVEHDEMSTWSEDNLRELRRKNINWFRLGPDSAKETWSLDDNTTLMTTFMIQNGGQLLNVAISEVERNDGTRMPARIDSRR